MEKLRSWNHKDSPIKIKKIRVQSNERSAKNSERKDINFVKACLDKKLDLVSRSSSRFLKLKIKSRSRSIDGD